MVITKSYKLKNLENRPDKSISVFSFKSRPTGLDFFTGCLFYSDDDDVWFFLISIAFLVKAVHHKTVLKTEMKDILQ